MFWQKSFCDLSKHINHMVSSTPHCHTLSTLLSQQRRSSELHWRKTFIKRWTRKYLRDCNENTNFLSEFQGDLVWDYKKMHDHLISSAEPWTEMNGSLFCLLCGSLGQKPVHIWWYTWNQELVRKTLADSHLSVINCYTHHTFHVKDSFHFTGGIHQLTYPSYF